MSRQLMTADVAVKELAKFKECYVDLMESLQADVEGVELLEREVRMALKPEFKPVSRSAYIGLGADELLAAHVNKLKSFQVMLSEAQRDAVDDSVKKRLAAAGDKLACSGLNPENYAFESKRLQRMLSSDEEKPVPAKTPALLAKFRATLRRVAGRTPAAVDSTPDAAPAKARVTVGPGT